MKVAIDGRLCFRDRAGIGRYVYELQSALARADTSAEVTLVLDARDTSTLAAVPVRRVGTPVRHRLERTTLPVELRGFDVVHFVDHGLVPMMRARQVVTVHDVSFLTYPDTHSSASRSYYAQAVRTLKAANGVIAVSAHVRNALLERQLARPATVRVIPEAPASAFAAPPEADGYLGSSTPYALFLGTIQPRKNLLRVASAFAAAAIDSDAQLLVAGALGYRGSEIVREITTRGRWGGRVRFLGRVSDRTAARLLRHARLALVLSIDEGFGLPVLEAMAAGTPCVVANAGALPETAGGAAELADPFDEDSMAAAIACVWTDDRRRSELTRLGRRRVQDFTWDRTARLTAEVYKNSA